MNNETTDMLSRINGVLEALYWLPTSGKVKWATLGNVEAWGTCYERQGLSFGRSKTDAEVLRGLTRQGLIESCGGRTKASSSKPTWAGLVAAMPGDGVTAKQLLVDLETLAGMQDRSKITLPGMADRRIVMAWELCPAVGEWFTKYERNFDAYNDELTQWGASLLPLLVMGWIRQLTDCHGVLWATELTDAGRQAMENPPDLTIPTGTAHEHEAWAEGWAWGLTSFINARPPPWTDSIVTRRLPASAWV